MPLKRHFLGWDAPVAEKVSAWLLGEKGGGAPVDLQDTLVIVPTLQAGRRLRETLARHCFERRTVLLSAGIFTPHHFFSLSGPGTNAASPSATMAAWTDVLAGADPAAFGNLFPQSGKIEGVDRFHWALATGDIIEQLRQELAEGGYTIPDVISRHGQDLQEPGRWRDLEELEKLFLRKLSALGLADACRLKIGLAEKPDPEPEFTRIVAACVPDPTPMAVRALENLSRESSVEVLIHAPEALAGKFDAWGRPVPGEWAREEVEIPGWDKSVFLEASPEAQAGKVLEIMESLPAEFGPADIGLGVPDLSVIPFLEKELRAAGLEAFNPADILLRDHALGRLVEIMFNLVRSRAYIHAADLLRHPDFLRYLEDSCGIASRGLLAELDRFQNRYLPVTLESMLAPFGSGNKAGGGARKKFPALGKALETIAGHAGKFAEKPFEEAWRSFLQAVYGVRRVGGENAEDREFQGAAKVVEDALRELRDIPEGKTGLGKDRFHDLFARRLRALAFTRERGKQVLDLQGWLELPWTGAPCMIVTGMNEEFVPGGSLSGVFLPDSLRKTLGLRDDLSRFARDVYLLKSMVESRRRAGRLFIIAGKCSLSGDPLRPSRLLFRCPAEELPARAGRLFKRIGPSGRVPAAEPIFRLKPAKGARDGGIIEEKKIPVTAFRDYLACPFRFYLKRVLEMETSSDDKTEMDALDFGQVIHEVLQAMGSDPELWGCGDAVRLGARLSELAAARVSAMFGKNLPMGALVALSSARARLEALAREQVEIAAAGWEILAAEQTLSAERHGFTIAGKIDRIDRHRESGAIRIIDYKTSDSAVSPESAHLGRRREDETRDYNRLVVPGKPGKKGQPAEKTFRWVDLQLPLYRLLFNPESLFEPRVELAYFNLPKAAGEAGLVAWDDFDGTVMASALECIRGVLEDIEGRVFWPPSEHVRYEDEFEALFQQPPEEAFDVKGFAK
ncbi:MAG: PD-(D/E)XK nuclease family protein [Kiritimatiellia bacterium]